MSITFIQESKCVGCSKCVNKCPTNAIVGKNFCVHSIITDNCINCNICINICPVNCIKQKKIIKKKL